MALCVHCTSKYAASIQNTILKDAEANAFSEANSLANEMHLRDFIFIRIDLKWYDQVERYFWYHSMRCDCVMS